MTDESKKDTEPWITDKGVKYAYAYDKGGKLSGRLGIPGLPHAFLVDATGKIVWEGHPGELKEADIEKALTGALVTPMWDWPASAKDAKVALGKRKYGDALAAASKLSEADSGPVIKSAIQGLVAGRVAGMKSALEAGDFLGAQDSANALDKELEGLPEAQEVKKTVEALKSTKDVDRVIKAQKVVRDLRAQRLGKKKELDKAITDLEKLAKELSGTYAATEAQDLVADLRMRKQKG